MLIKDIINIKETKYNIYKVNCNNCDKMYIGESSLLKKRMKQHAKNVDEHENKTALTNLAIKFNHTFDFTDVKLLDKERNNMKRKRKENIHIIKNRNKIFK